MLHQGVWSKIAIQVVSKLRVSLEDDSGQSHSAFRFGYWKLVLELSNFTWGVVPTHGAVMFSGMRATLVVTFQD